MLKKKKTIGYIDLYKLKRYKNLVQPTLLKIFNILSKAFGTTDEPSELWTKLQQFQIYQVK